MPSIIEHDRSKMRFNASSMIFVRFLLQTLVIWCIIYFINHLLLRYHGTKRPYNRLLRSLGCHVSLLNIGFYTTSFNRAFYRIGTTNSRLWKIWFTVGILVAFATAVTSCVTLLILPIKYIYELQRRHSVNTNVVISTQGDTRILTDNSSNRNDAIESDRDKLLIQPIIPGVNVPLEQMPHFFLALLICTVFHEFGHAVAASAEQIRVNGCGYFLFLLYPGAYVDLHQEQLQMISAVRQLRIYCAGVFHNMVLVIIAVIFLLLNPLFLRYFYTEAATVYRVAKDSPIRDLLPVHSTIQSIDACIVNTSNDWYKCLRLTNDRPPQHSSGHCLTQSEIQIHSSHIELNQRINFDCCQNLSQKNYCFLYHSKQYPDHNGACMEARIVTKHPSCLINSDCQSYSGDASCVHPFSFDNVTRLIRIAHSSGPAILFVGSIHEIYRTISIQSYKPNYKYFPTILIDDVPLFFQYLGAFSFALAFFNAVPCYALDGQYILSSFVEYLSPSLFKRRRASILLGLICGTCLLIINVTLAFARYFL
ncbi:unnamed protein product [Rotaria magnacalcarata]|uniref:Membrane-bound transcription factor site-2 protease n=2 Tax=Rotaria magnacalcarata TaxID=392030 RepID=A0A814DMC9_9BILA|nr:unnamed protein product [Rotaria magnacalcarata]CAF1371183.1 unnamed protein product [Rotaria magnacalcarata]CAF1903421.1 unnamed protein product [Rotaria magnacalcarata]CAF2047619.1 unnamed protein product [Rotaria magnacalcarata]